MDRKKHFKLVERKEFGSPPLKKQINLENGRGMNLITQNDNSSRRCLWRNTSCSIRIVDQQEITTGRAVKTLSVHSRNIGGAVRIQSE